jgi:hypothetical protein
LTPATETQKILFMFFVLRVFSAKPAILGKLKLLGGGFLVLHRRVIFPLTLGASQRNYLSHENLQTSKKRQYDRLFQNFWEFLAVLKEIFISQQQAAIIQTGQYLVKRYF